MENTYLEFDKFVSLILLFFFIVSSKTFSFQNFFSKLSKVKFLVSDILNKGGGNRTKMDLLF